MSDSHVMETEAIIEEFRRLCRIPHGSGHEEKLGEYLMERLESFGAKVTRDQKGNILGEFPEEDKAMPGIMLQAHFDMVLSGEAKEDTPIVCIEEENFLKSDGKTTLGADNGIGIAIILKLIEKGNPYAGPLKVLFTVEEEVGLKGAKEVSTDWFSNVKYLINTDGFSSDTAITGCKGGLRETFFVGIAKEELLPDSAGENLLDDNLLLDSNDELSLDTNWEKCELSLKGFLGGHSGEDIDKGRCNTIKTLAGLLVPMVDRFKIRIESLSGGRGYNVIPGEASCRFFFPSFMKEELRIYLNDVDKRIRKTYGESDSEGAVLYGFLYDDDDMVWTKEFQSAILRFLSAAEDGVCGMDRGEVSASSNLGLVREIEGGLEIGAMIRCDKGDSEEEILSLHKSLADRSGFDVKVEGYHGWHSEETSKLLDAVDEVYIRHKGTPIKRKVAKVGLEPAYFKEISPETEMVCLGADILDAHSVKERVRIESIGLLYKVMEETLVKLS